MGAKTQYVDVDGEAVAFQVTGQGRDLTTVLGLSSHVDLRWSIPSIRATLEELSSFCRLISFDRRGIGASERRSPYRIPTWEDWVVDLAAVLDAVGSRRTWLLGSLDGGPYALLFAATFPERVSGLILANTAARFVQDSSFPVGVPPSIAESLVAAISNGWGTEEFASLAQVSDSKEWEAAALLQRASATRSVAVAHYRQILEVDLREAAERISVPTVVFHRAEHPFVPVELGRDLADRVPGATFVELPGSRGLLDGADRAGVMSRLAELITGRAPVVEGSRHLAAVLFTDLVASTHRAEQARDAHWRSLLDEHDRRCTTSIERYGGRVVKFTGDGTVAVFDRPSDAIEAALDIREALELTGLQMRAGVHFAEIETRADDLAGINVHVSQRIEAEAEAGEILVSRTVVDLIRGAELVCEPRGPRRLKGVSGEWDLYSVERTR